jgi:MFS family permease
MAAAFVSLLFMTATVAADVFFAKDYLEIGDIGYGLLLTTWTLGMVLGATFLPKRIAAGSVVGAALVAIVVQGLGIAGPTLWLAPVLAFAFFLVGGVAHGTKNVLVRTLIHERVPSTLHGRAYAAYNALRNGAELIALVGGGLLVAALGARWTLFLAGVLPMAAGVVALAVTRRRLSEPTAAGSPA